MADFPENFVENFLQLHNQYRATHEAPPLVINDDLNNYAQEWADNLAAKGVLEHRPETEYGENIFISTWKVTDRQIKPSDPLDEWYREGRFFNYKAEERPNLQDVRNFTQMIWKESTTIGVGMATGPDERIYFVCNYDPPGNGDEFANNVSPVTETDQELLPNEADTVKIFLPRPEVAKSMERLYAVPSEELRVWLIWLTKVGDFVDEWQRWIRSHIDFVVRLSDHLEAAALAIKQSKLELLQVEVLSSSIQDDETSEAQRDRDSSIYEEARDTVGDEDANVETEAAAEPEAAPATEPSETLADATQNSEEGEEEDDSKIWPIGTPWDPTGLEDECKEEEFEKLPMPCNEEEMREFLNKFTHEATIYRSYYKHWKETTDEAIKEIGGRLVLETFRVQGKNELGCVKQPTQAQKRSCKDNRNDRVVTLREYQERPSLSIPASDKAAKNDAEATEDENAEDEPKEDEAPQEEDAEAEGATDEDTEEQTAKSKSSKKAKRKSQSRTRKSQPLEASDCVKECARAEEPIPYVFYLKAEPDIDIAIEHDDGEVILADLDRESVKAKRRRIFFNLADKPCIGGKPWI